ncbi:Hsp20/alpha crystallin family protein [Alicyclobacillus sp.]|uniref:Hsp20/alpha crystallin family protein n=1 Tax=Alicyclobacillus sp. TaxID=61169 RepID=UPI0025BC6DA8|nr:Hsp20/alpha crystallin family protein [Alicyclobacillus sp.]MCL6515800.1 Hsp20/alpha crystallin family protein [Alicyclobacillus sp.]
MNAPWFDGLPYLQQMGEHFRKLFGEDFVQQLMKSVQPPAAWQNPGTPGPARNGAEPGGTTGFPWMGGLPGWNPFAATGAEGMATGRPHPCADVYETRHEVVVVLEIPGLEREKDVRIAVYPDELVVKGEVVRHYERSAESLTIRERFAGPFERRIHLPVRVRRQHAKATYRAGLLEVRMIKEGRQTEGEGTVVDIDFL